MRSKRKGFGAGRMSLRTFAILMVMTFLVQETVLSVMAELPTNPTEDLVTILSYDDDDDVVPTVIYDDDDDSVTMAGPSQTTRSRTPGGTTTFENEIQKPEIVEKITQKTPEKSKTTKFSAGMVTLPSSESSEVTTIAGGTSPVEDLELTTAVGIPSTSGAMHESTEGPATHKMTDAIIGQRTTEAVTSGYTLFQNLPTTTSLTSTVVESLPTASGLPTSDIITSSTSSSSSSSSSSSTSTAATLSTAVYNVTVNVSLLSTAVYGVPTNVSQPDRYPREATTPSEIEDEKCADYTFEPDKYLHFIQEKDLTQELFTRFEMLGRGVFGGDYWNKSSLLDVEDDYVRVDLRNELIIGELYEIRRSWCDNNSCPEIGKCPVINITRGIKATDVDSFQLLEATTTSALFFWSLHSIAYIPELTISLNLTNEKQPPVERTVAAIIQSVYSMDGSFKLDNLASGARYRLRLAAITDEEEWNTSETEFITVPAMPENLSFQQLNYNTANVTWHQPFYSDSFNISYGPENSTLETSEIHDSYLVLKNLTQGTVYNISVIAQTQNLISVPNKMILRLEPPSLGIEVLRENTTTVSMKMTTTENIERVSIFVDQSPSLNFTNVNGVREFTIPSLTPGKAYQLKFKYSIREFVWKKYTTIATKPLPPENVSIDNTNYRGLEVCWKPPTSGGFDSFLAQFNSLQRVAPSPTDNGTFCYSQNVQPGAVYNISVSTLSNNLRSDPSTQTALARPAPPYVTEITKTTTSVSIAVSCPKDNFHHVNVTFCGKRDVDCTRRELSCSNSKEEILTEGGLTPGNRYTFTAVSVQFGGDDLRAESDVIFRQITTYPPPPTDLSVTKISGLEIVIQWHSTCVTCNYSVEAVPHNRSGEHFSEDSTCYDGVEHDEYVLCQHSLVIPREQLYNITVKSLSWGAESLTGDTVHDITMPKAIKYVTNIRLLPVLPSLLSVNFNPPEVPHEDITKYEIDYHGERKPGEFCSSANFFHYPDHPLPINVTVKGGCLYVFSIKTFFGSKAGEVAVAKNMTTIGAPVAKNIVPRYPDSSVTHEGFEVIFNPEMFSDENGPLEYFTVIVAEASDGSHNALVQLDSMLPGWSESIRKTPIPPYQILPRMPVTYSDESSSGISKRSVIVSQPVMVGNQSCGNTDETYCNGPLIGGRSYIYWFRGFTNAGFADTLPSQQFPLPKTQSNLIIACLIILMILFLIVIILIGLLLRKRLRMDSKGDYQPAPTESVLLKSMSKNSSRAKYIRAIKLTEFCQDFHVMSAHSNFGYSQEFENLRRVGKKLTSYDAVLPENVSKNRYTNILPYDRTRVKLGSIDDELGSDYINANWIPGFSSPREYIACQGPLPGTVDDMWRMIWEKNVTMIVMVTQLVEKGKVKCDQYWPEDHKPVFYGDIQVTMTQSTETESWNMREFNLYKPYVDQKKKVKHFNYLSWPDHGVPENSESLLNFIEVVRQQSPKNGSPTIIHCSAGCGRTGTFICLDRLLQQVEEFDYVNILGTVAEMRSHRQHMVQTEQQYVFIHRCVLDILEEKGIAPKPSPIPMNGNTGGTLLLEAIV